MHASEAHQFEFCASCGAEVQIARDRGYALDAERVLCFPCAVQRGGSYDEHRDLWVEAPDLANLARDRKP